MAEVARVVAITQDHTAARSLASEFAARQITLYTIQHPDQLPAHLARPAEASADNAAIDVVLLDAQHDDDAGIAAVRHIRESYTADRLPIIVLLGTEHCDVITGLLRAGASDFLLAPPTADAIFERIEAAVTVHEKVDRLLETERRRILSETLARSSAIAATALGKIVDRLEALMRAATASHSPPGGLDSVLEGTEHAVDVIDCLRQISVMDNVPYTARQHLLDQIAGVD